MNIVTIFLIFFTGITTIG